MKFTEKQTALLSDLEAVFPGRGIIVSGYFATHSLRTAKSLERKGWLTLLTDGSGESHAMFSSNNYADWLEFKGSNESVAG
jgi:hypothetical protein